MNSVDWSIEAGTLAVIVLAGLVALSLLAWVTMEATMALRNRRVRPLPEGPIPSTPSAQFNVLIRGRNLVKSYKTPSGEIVQALRGVDIEVNRGELVAIVGESGIGKSTLGNLLAFLDVPDSGTLTFQGWTVPSEEGPALLHLRRTSSAPVFQSLNLVSHLTAEENVALPLVLAGVPWGQATREGRRMLESMRMEPLARRKPHQMSGGQQQRVAILRAALAPSPLIVADEPTGNLDPSTAAEVMAMFQSLARKQHKALVVITHSPQVAVHCDRTLRMTVDGLKQATSADPEWRFMTYVMEKNR